MFAMHVPNSSYLACCVAKYCSPWTGSACQTERCVHCDPVRLGTDGHSSLIHGTVSSMHARLHPCKESVFTALHVHTLLLTPALLEWSCQKGRWLRSRLMVVSMKDSPAVAPLRCCLSVLAPALPSAIQNHSCSSGKEAAMWSACRLLAAPFGCRVSSTSKSAKIVYSQTPCLPTESRHRRGHKVAARHV